MMLSLADGLPITSISVRSGRCEPPCDGSLSRKRSPARASSARTAATDSGIAPRCTGMCAACATILPRASKIAHDASRRSRMFGEIALRSSNVPISSASMATLCANTVSPSTSNSPASPASSCFEAAVVTVAPAPVATLHPRSHHDSVPSTGALALPCAHRVHDPAPCSTTPAPMDAERYDEQALRTHRWPGRGRVFDWRHDRASRLQ